MRALGAMPGPVPGVRVLGALVGRSHACWMHRVERGQAWRRGGDHVEADQGEACQDRSAGTEHSHGERHYPRLAQAPEA